MPKYDANLSTARFREFAGAIVSALPNNLDLAIQQYWIRAQREEIANLLYDALSRKFNSSIYDKRQDGWELLEDIADSPIDPTKLEIVSFVKPGERSLWIDKYQVL